MLETYVQELGAAEIWIRFPVKTRNRVKVLGDLFLRLLHVCGPVAATTASNAPRARPPVMGRVGHRDKNLKNLKSVSQSK